MCLTNSVSAGGSMGGITSLSDSDSPCTFSGRPGPTLRVWTVE